MDNLEMLIDNEMNNGELILTVNEMTRELEYNGNLVIGVEGDYKADRVYFISPKIVGDNIDVSASTVQIYIDYKNALNEPYITQSTDKAVQTDGTVKFSWVLGANVAAKKGQVKFRVCFKNINTSGELTNEWHTTYTTGEILEGIDVSEKTPEVITDQTTSAAQMLERMDEMEALFNNVTGYTKDEVDAKVSDRATKQEVDDINERLESIEDKDLVVGSRLEQHVKTEIDNLKADVLPNYAVKYDEKLVYTRTYDTEGYIVYDGQSPANTCVTLDKSMDGSFVYGDETFTYQAGDRLRVKFMGGSTFYSTCQTGVLDIELTQVTGVNNTSSIVGKGSYMTVLGGQYTIIGAEFSETVSPTASASAPKITFFAYTLNEANSKTASGQTVYPASVGIYSVHRLRKVK